ncbi:hypothetical protein ACJX0J_032716, partial [Zea mays]
MEMIQSNSFDREIERILFGQEDYTKILDIICVTAQAQWQRSELYGGTFSVAQGWIRISALHVGVLPSFLYGRGAQNWLFFDASSLYSIESLCTQRLERKKRGIGSKNLESENLEEGMVRDRLVY